MPVGWWFALMGGGIVAGAALVCALVAPKPEEILALGGAVAATAVSVWGLAGVVTTYRQADVAIAAFMLGIGAFVGGYELAASLLPALARRPRTSSGPLTGLEDGEEGPPFVLVVSDAEPEHYSPSFTAAELLHTSASGGPPTPVTIAPFVFAAAKARYRAVGGTSPSREQTERLAQACRRTLGEEVSAVSVAWSTGSPSPAEVVSSLAREGARRFIVLPLGIGESPAFDRAMREVDALRLDGAGITCTTTPPLWTSEALALFLAGRILQSSGEQRTGVVLVCHALLPEEESAHPGYSADQMAFVGRVRMALEEGGIDPADVRAAWSEWREPDVTEAVRHLTALGCKNILIAPVCEPTASISTLFDLPHSARLARAEIAWRALPAWGDDPSVAEVLAEAVRLAVEEQS